MEIAVRRRDERALAYSVLAHGLGSFLTARLCAENTENIF